MAYDPNASSNIALSVTALARMLRNKEITEEDFELMLLQLERVSCRIKPLVESIKSGEARAKVRKNFADLENDFWGIYNANGGLGVLEAEVKKTGRLSTSLKDHGFKKSDLSYSSIGHRLKNKTISLLGISANRSGGKITVQARIKNITSSSTYVNIPKGTVFENNSMEEQNIASGEDKKAYIPAGATKTITFTGFCINKERSWPSNSSLTLTILESLCTTEVLNAIKNNEQAMATIKAIDKAQSEIWKAIEQIRDALK